MSEEKTKKGLLIIGLHPHLLEKPVFWFEKNQRSILNARHINSFWQQHALVFEEGLELKMSEALRRIADLGYGRMPAASHPGTVAAVGGEIHVFPINTRAAYRIEFFGNSIEHIKPLQHSEESRELDTQQKKLLRRNALESLRPGDFVVHTDHGIGIYKGIETRNNASYVAIEYAAPSARTQNDMLYVPEELIKRVTPYVGFRTPTVHRLGTQLWNTTKRKAREDIVAFAKELLKLYAAREVAERPRYTTQEQFEYAVAADFPFEETPDQAQSITEVLGDMARSQPMDRLLLADVGFGKTEVALRAALRAAANNRQVALIAPTTILAEQHFQTFTERLKNIPITIERLSRLESKKEQTGILRRIQNGATDIVIGTHRLLSKDIAFKNLGLLIIDEEQRFGVKQKEKLKAAHREHVVDVLSLSATPIPRTLHFSLSSLKPMSIISTPPAGRMPPKTFVLPFSQQTATQALTTELERGGQAYYLANRINKLPLMKEFILQLVPTARIGILHGRMKEQDIIQTMNDFREHKTDILLATTIIENGLDISNANTLIIEDATRIGLAEAHQLRGRIGRSAVQSYAYFLYPSHKLKDKAQMRLDALLRTQYLGAGKDIALRDMEIRGAGNILGRDQSGRVNQIGLNLYCQMLADAVAELRSK